MALRQPILLALTVLALAACGAHTDGISPATRRAAVTELAAHIDAHDVDAAAGARLAALLRTRARAGAYDAIDDSAALAQRLSRELQEASGDARLRVELATPVPWWRRLREDDAGIEYERIGADIGYIAVRAFTPPARSARRYARAFGKLSNTRTIIVDLRENRGGDPDGLQLLASYVVDRPIHYADLAARDGAREPRWAFPQLAARPYLEQLTILIGPRTGAEAENFAYAMQAWKRATVVGARSAGVTSAVRTYPLGAGLVATLPAARATLPHTGAGWPGGVSPDVATDGDALRTAKRRILTDRLAHVTTPMGRSALLAMLNAL